MFFLLKDLGLFVGAIASRRLLGGAVVHNRFSAVAGHAPNSDNNRVVVDTGSLIRVRSWLWIAGRHALSPSGSVAPRRLLGGGCCTQSFSGGGVKNVD